jgi:hypothetical protein
MFSSSEIGIPTSEEINFGELIVPVTCTGEATIPMQQEKLERYI